jgi:hypothetical protein
MLCLSYYCLFLLFNGTGEKHRTAFAWKWRGRGKGQGKGVGGEMTQTMYAHVSKWIKKCMLQEVHFLIPSIPLLFPHSFCPVPIHPDKLLISSVWGYTVWTHIVWTPHRAPVTNCHKVSGSKHHRTVFAPISSMGNRKGLSLSLFCPLFLS